LVCDAPITVRHGDQIILRDQSLDVTLGGGPVIHASENLSPRRRAPQRLAMLNDFDQSSPQMSLRQLLARGPVDIQHFADVWHLPATQMDELLGSFEVLKVAGMAVAKQTLTALQDQALQQISAHQAEQASSPGLKENAFVQIPAIIRQRLLNAMVQANVIENVGGYYRVPNHEATLPAELLRAWQLLEKKLDLLQPPSTGDLAKQTDIAQNQLEKDLKALAKRGYVIHVANHRFYLPRQLEAVATHIRQLAADQPFSVREFRDRTGIGRNVAIEVLEYFDGRGFTRRQGNERIVLKADY
jgi:selenocysteine-specific elongation factor